MKSPEEKKADREARFRTTVMAPRIGWSPETTEEPPTPSPVVQGLKLSEVLFWPIEQFKPHPSNHVFDSAKTETYWRDLRRDILEAGAILNPLITLRDGTLLEGHSRLRVARELAAEGHDLGRIPVRVVYSSITAAEAERRVYLGNLSRFELKDETRLTLYAKVWPGYFGQEGKPGRPEKSTHGETITAKVIGRQIGKSVQQVKRDRAVVISAKKIAAEKGKPDADAEDIREAQRKAALKRRASANTAHSRRIALPRGHVQLFLRMLRQVKAPSTVQMKIIRELEEVLRGK